MPQQKHASSSYARILFRHLRLSAENHRGFFDGTNVTYDELMALDGTIPPNDFARICRNALVISGLADLGLSVGAQLQMSTHGPLGVATFSGPDLRTGLTLLAKYGLTRTEFFDITLSAHPKGLNVHFAETSDLADVREFVTESVLSGLFAAITLFVGPGQFNGQLHFAYPKPSYWFKYRDYFGSNMIFDQPATEVFVAESMLSMPSPVADPILHQESVALCEQQLKAIVPGTASDTSVGAADLVSQLLRENPGRLWTLNEVAKQLHISPRTLMRKLDSAGTKFQSVRDTVSKEQAADYLKDPSLSVESVGHLMGFSDTSSFRRSFKRWFGETPSQYTARIRSD